MKRLLLLRHAKTERDNPRGDHARELTGRGIADAALMGGRIKALKLQPDAVLCSTAARAMQTWEHLAPFFKKTLQPQFADALYLAPPRVILQQARGAPDRAATLLVIGHNPGMEECASQFARREGSEEEFARLAMMREKFPTAALAAFAFDAEHWKDIAFGGGALISFETPKDFKDD